MWQSGSYFSLKERSTPSDGEQALKVSGRIPSQRDAFPSAHTQGGSDKQRKILAAFPFLASRLALSLHPKNS